MVSIIIPWANREELRKTLPSILQNAKEVNGEVIIVNLSGDYSLLQQQISFCEDKIRIIDVKNITCFNKPLAQNIGSKYAVFPYLFFCDCDVILPKYILRKLYNRVFSNKGSFGTIKNVRETKINSKKANHLVHLAYEITLEIKDGTKIKIMDSEENILKGIRSAHGLLLVKRHDFENVNGYNRHIVGWGWEDIDIICRLMLYAKLKHILLGVARHISHGDDLRMHHNETYDDRWHNRDCMFRQAIASYDQGYFLGTYGEDCKNCKSTVKIFP
jgi:predicted glycosyltransferase involved in capsule biosynthesis